MAAELKSETQIEIIIEPTKSQSQSHCEIPPIIIKRSISISLTQILTSFHAGYFRISLSLCSQALLWKLLGERPAQDAHPFRRLLSLLPSAAFSLLWSVALFTLTLLSLVYILRCLFHFKMVQDEFLHHVGVNYLFAPWISWLLLLQSSPFISPKSMYYLVLWWIFVVPILVLDVKIYGQWFTKGKRFVSVVANPTSQISVIGNLVAAKAAAQMGWGETAVCMFSLAPSMASLAWDAIVGTFDNVAKMLFFLSLFLFLSLVSRPALFRKSMKKFSVTWWAYSFPITVLALASAEYAQEVKSGNAQAMMLVLSALSVLVSLALMVFTAINTNMFVPDSLRVSSSESSSPPSDSSNTLSPASSS
ncbi:S-type anion channel SLAH1 [Citrus sinensis]|nr:S-type anion channel SLAH1 [Citrus sinensis]